MKFPVNRKTHERFLAVVARATERAAREEREHMASLRPAPRTKEEARQAQRQRQAKIVYGFVTGGSGASRVVSRS